MDLKGKLGTGRPSDIENLPSQRTYCEEILNGQTTVNSVLDVARLMRKEKLQYLAINRDGVLYSNPANISPQNEFLTDKIFESAATAAAASPGTVLHVDAQTRFVVSEKFAGIPSAILFVHTEYGWLDTDLVNAIFDHAQKRQNVFVFGDVDPIALSDLLSSKIDRNAVISVNNPFLASDVCVPLKTSHALSGEIFCGFPPTKQVFAYQLRPEIIFALLRSGRKNIVFFSDYKTREELFYDLQRLQLPASILKDVFFVELTAAGSIDACVNGTCLAYDRSGFIVRL